MATPTKTEWLVILPDLKDALPRRMSVRPQHIEALKPNVDAGNFVLAGVTLDEPITPSKLPSINGSVLLVVAATREDVLEIVKKDIYNENNVWDWEKAQIIPFKSAARSAL
ncbi:hypothetical protein AMS68_003715 [Peltaster fructicola]|uniref:YCII-related domain-containing protein n=1 Tax=Peltaster fructicola TaxID=286661 RepID=A0A6H0XUA7_9PEZI|nr:hypothetical protein AMS68_003715 [Peltaster fructicola]